MIVKDIIDILEGEIICEGELVNPQVVRTAEMMDMACIVFVRGKMPDDSIINLAEQRGITLIKTRFRMFTACGRLYANGLSGGTKV